jgi:hypothetical protein
MADITLDPDELELELETFGTGAATTGARAASRAVKNDDDDASRGMLMRLPWHNGCVL